MQPVNVVDVTPEYAMASRPRWSTPDEAKPVVLTTCTVVSVAVASAERSVESVESRAAKSAVAAPAGSDSITSTAPTSSAWGSAGTIFSLHASPCGSDSQGLT